MKKKIIMMAVFAALVCLTIYTLTARSSTFSWQGFFEYVRTASWQWILLAFVCIFLFIFFEGMSLRCICRHFGNRCSVPDGFLYSAADIYFSAITPSASGGQPASAYCMMKNGIPGALSATSLIINVAMYAMAIIILGAVCLIFNFRTFLCFSPLSQTLIVIGMVIHCALVLILAILLVREKIIYSLADGTLNILHRMKLMKNVEQKKEKLKKSICEYKHYGDVIRANRMLSLKVLLYNLAQRISYISATVCVFLSRGGSHGIALNTFATQCFVILGASTMPIPGAVGVSDYLFIDGFSHSTDEIVNIELLSRGISFYSCVLFCGIVFLTWYVVTKIKSEREKE